MRGARGGVQIGQALFPAPEARPSILKGKVQDCGLRLPAPFFPPSALAMHHARRRASMAALPDDVLLLIISYVEVNDILSLRGVRLRHNAMVYLQLS